MDLFKVLIFEGNINQAVELTWKMDDPTLIEKMRYMAKSKGIDCGDSQDNIEEFGNVSNLKKATDVCDTNLIYSLNCQELGGNGPSFVFKTNKYALETAVRMDPNTKTTHGRRSLLSYEKASFDIMHKRCQGFKTLTLWTHHPGM